MPGVRAGRLATRGSAGGDQRPRHGHRLSPSVASGRCPSASRPVPGGPASLARPAAWAYGSRAALPVAAWAVFLALSRVLTALTSSRGAVTRHRGTLVGFPGPPRLNRPQRGSASAPRAWDAGPGAVVVSRGSAAAAAGGRPGFGGVAGGGQHGEERADPEPFLGGV